MKYLEGIAEFCAVAEVGNFTGAANKLDTSVAQISRKVASLEKQLGVKLLQRTTRSVSLTEAGTQYFQQALPALKALEDAQLSVSAHQASPQGLIKLTAPVAFGEAFIAPLLNTFMQKYAGISVQCTFSNEKLDIVELGLDLAIRIGKLEDSTRDGCGGRASGAWLPLAQCPLRTHPYALHLRRLRRSQALQP